MALTLSCPVTAAAVIGDEYSSSMVEAGGTAPFIYALTGGALPPGLVLNPASGLLSGVPTLTGSFPYSVTVTDSLSATAAADCVLTVGLPVPDINVIFCGYLRYLVEKSPDSPGGGA